MKSIFYTTGVLVIVLTVFFTMNNSTMETKLDGLQNAIREGVKPNASLFNQETILSQVEMDQLLFLAVSEQDLQWVLLLIHNGANVNARTDYSGTPLLVAVERGDASVVRALLENGADPSHANDFGVNAAIAICRRGDLELVNLIGDFDPNARYEVKAGAHKGKLNSSAIEVAVIEGNLTMLRELLAIGARPDISTTSGETLVQMAMRLNHDDLIPLLVME
jgi:ankyrin repeat protein